MPLVTNPTAGDVHVNRPLTNFSQKYLQDAQDFVAMRAIPNLPVAMQSDLYYTFDRDDYYRDDAAERADGTESAGTGFSLSTDAYQCRVFAHHKDITDRQRANQDRAVRLDQSATQLVMQKMMIRAERQFAAEVFSQPATGGWSSTRNINWENSDVGSTSPTDPLVDIREMRRGVKGLTGYNPGRLILSRKLWDLLLDNDYLIDRYKGGATTGRPAQTMRDVVARLMELDSIMVMDGIYTSSVRGAAAPSRAWIGSENNALLAHLPAQVGLDTPTAAVRFSWTGFLGATQNGIRIKRFRMEWLESDRIEGQYAFDFRVTSRDLGAWLTQAS